MEQIENLTLSEYKVVSLAITGATNTSIAAQLNLSIRTITQHLSNSYSKLYIHNKCQLLWLFHKNNGLKVGPNRRKPTLELDVIRLNKNKLLTVKQVALRLNCSYQTALVYLKKHDLFVPQRQKKFIIYDGESLSLKELSIKFKIPEHSLYQRLYNLGWDVEKALLTPINVKHRPKAIKSSNRLIN